MSTPVIIRHDAPLRNTSQAGHGLYGSSPSGSLPPCSPPAAYSYHSPLGVAGASPPFRGGSTSAAADKANPYLAAKKFWKRLCFDPALDPTEYTIGFIETVQQPERKSGVEAWSMRLHDRLVELPYTQFVEYFCGGGGGGGSLLSLGSGHGTSGGSGRQSSGGSGGGGGGEGAGPSGQLQPRHASPSAGGWGGGFLSTSEEAGSDVPYHRIAYYKHGGLVVWESEYHRRRLNDLPPALGLPSAAAAAPHPPHPPHPPHGASGSSSSEGAAVPAAGTPLGERMRRRASREGMPPLPLPHHMLSSSPGSSLPMFLFGGSSAGGAGGSNGGGGGGSGARGGSGGSGVAGRSPKGASPLASEDGGDAEGAGDSDRDGDDDEEAAELLLLEEEEEEDEGGGGEEAAGAEEAGRTSAAAASQGRRYLVSDGLSSAAWGAAVGGFGGLGQQQRQQQQVHQGEEAPVMPQLPEECWMEMLQQLGVRDVCMVGRTCRWLRQLAADPVVWRSQFESLWGRPPEPHLAPAVVRRMCRRSQLRAARWVEAAVRSTPGMGFPSTTCLQMDDSKVVSGDGNAVRLWSHATGRRIATLQGHPGRVTAVAFDEALLVSGCAGAVVKLWSMDELRCKRTLRGHEGAVSSCCLLPTGIPVSGSEDGVMRLWDVSSGAAIVGLEAGQPVRAMQPHAPSGHLVVAAGGGVQIWDVSTATLLHTLGTNLPAAAAAGGEHLPGEHHVAAAGDMGGQQQQQQQHPYTCVSYMGELLAAGRQGEVVLMDPRVGSAVGRICCNVRSSGGGGGGGAGLYGNQLGGGGAFANGLGAIAAAAAGGSHGGGGGCGGRGAHCVGVQMDEWKLVTGFNDGSHQLHVYDIRSLPQATTTAAAAAAGTTVTAAAAPHSNGSSSASGGGGGAAWTGCSVVRRPWHVPLMTLQAPARINAFQFHEQALLAGLEGSECVVWRFESPHIAGVTSAGPPMSLAAGAAAGAAALAVGGAGRSGGAGGSGGGGGVSSGGGGGGAEGGGGDAAGGGGRKEKKKPAKVAKKQTRYPKRNTK